MTTHDTYDLYAIGNALVDSEYEVSDAQLQARCRKAPHDADRRRRRAELLRHVQGVHARRTGGGSAGNTVVALAQLGGGPFTCRVADDDSACFFTKTWSQRRGHQPDQHPGHRQRPDRQLHGDGDTRRRTQHEHLSGSNCRPGPHRLATAWTLPTPASTTWKAIWQPPPPGWTLPLQGRKVAKDAGVALATT
jgi:hypothetical protein